MGTPHYMSPEQLKDSKSVTHLGDIYSFGVTLFYMLTGCFPYDDDDDNLGSLTLKILHSDAPRASYFREGLPSAIADLIAACLSRDMRDRPQNCRKVMETMLSIDWTLASAGEATVVEVKRGSDEFMIETSSPGSARRKRLEPPPSPRRDLNEPSWASGDRPDPGALDSFDDDNDIDPDMFAAFPRRSRVPYLLALILLFLGVAFGTKAFLESNDQAAAASPPDGIGSTEISAPERTAEVEQPAETAIGEAADTTMGTGEGEEVAVLTTSGTGPIEPVPDETPVEPDAVEAVTEPVEPRRERRERPHRSEPTGRSSTGLVGREAERAAELEWARTHGSGSSDESDTATRTLGDDSSRRSVRDEGDSAEVPREILAQVEEPPDEELTPLQINTALRASRTAFRNCYDAPDSGPVTMRISIRPNGSVSYASATDRNANAIIVRCIVQVLSRISFDSFDGSTMNVRHTFTAAGP
jgi:hypothetical protein